MPHDSPFRIRLRIRAIRAHGFYSLFSGKSYHKTSAYFEILWACLLYTSEKTSDDNESAGIYRGLYRRRIQQEAGRQEARERPAYAATVLLGAVVCVLGVTAYLNHEKMAEMEQTLAQMKGTRYVTEAQTADTGAEDTERMPSVAVETVIGNVEKQELSAEAGKVQEDVTAQQAETAQGAQGTAEPAENAAENAAAGNAALSLIHI